MATTVKIDMNTTPRRKNNTSLLPPTPTSPISPPPLPPKDDEQDNTSSKTKRRLPKFWRPRTVANSINTSSPPQQQQDPPLSPRLSTEALRPSISSFTSAAASFRPFRTNGTGDGDNGTAKRTLSLRRVRRPSAPITTIRSPLSTTNAEETSSNNNSQSPITTASSHDNNTPQPQQQPPLATMDRPLPERSDDTIAIMEAVTHQINECLAQQQQQSARTWKGFIQCLDEIQAKLDSDPSLDQYRDRISLLKQECEHLSSGSLSSNNNDALDRMANSIRDVCYTISCAFLAKQSYVAPLLSDKYAYEEPCASPRDTDYASMWPDHMDRQSTWFRQHFVGKPYITFIGSTIVDHDDNHVSVIISVTLETESNNFRVIARATDRKSTSYFVIPANQVWETKARLEALGMVYKRRRRSRPRLLPSSDEEEEDYNNTMRRRHPLRSISAAVQKVDQEDQELLIYRAAVLSVWPDLDIDALTALSAQATILAGLEKELLRFDEMTVPKHYKFGLLTVRDGQNSEEAWFSNSGLSAELELFLELIGHRVELKGFTGYAAGLDTKAGETGQVSFASRWRDHEIMFHVAPLMPCRDHDRQQVHRKRHIGNDIVCVVFIEGSGKFDPTMIRSQFLHVFIVVRLERINGRELWRIETIRNANVAHFGPLLPDPPFLPSHALRDYLLLKMINAENAALKSDKFAIPNAKARAGIMRNLVETGLQYVQQNGNATSGRRGSNQDGKFGASTLRIERPRSTGAGSSPSFHIRPCLDDIGSGSPIPPVPTRSRSSMLRDLTTGFARRQSQRQDAVVPEKEEKDEGIRHKAHHLVTSVMKSRGGASRITDLSRSNTVARGGPSQTSLRRSNTTQQR